MFVLCDICFLTTCLFLMAGLIMVLTLHSVVTTRQKYKRHMHGRPLSRPVVMFPRVTYKEANRDVTHCIKYLLNFGFFRFGIEVCLFYPTETNVYRTNYFILTTVVTFNFSDGFGHTSTCDSLIFFNCFKMGNAKLLI